MRFRSIILLSFAIGFFAAVSSPIPVPSAVITLQDQSQQAVVTGQSFLASVGMTIGAFGGYPWFIKVAVVCLLLVSLLKVTALDDLLWKKLGAFQTWAAPLLSLIGGISILGAQGTLTLKGVFAYLSTGIGAVALHELLDSAKGLPWLGPGYKTAIGWVESKLGGSSVPNPAPGDPVQAPPKA